MRNVREALRLKFQLGLSDRQIARSLGISKGGLYGYFRRARAAGLTWPLPEELTDGALEQMLFPGQPKPVEVIRAVPNWAYIDQELRRPGVTRALLWEEYRRDNPDGWGYSWFCEHFEAWKGRVSPTMRQHHVAGEKVFVDFAGDTIDIFDPVTGVAQPMKLFVAALGASSYIYAQAQPSEGLADWIGAHVAMFAFFGGVTKTIVCDNLKAGVTKPDRYEPSINRTYQDLATHYNTIVIPARPYKPRDKAKVEQSVLVAQRWILACLRNSRFFSLAELNQAIAALLNKINNRIMRGYGLSRAELFAKIDAPALQPLPAEPYVFATWKRARVAPDYHIQVHGCWYSAPYRLIRQLVDVRITNKTVEMFFKGQRIAAHAKAIGLRHHVTIDEHMPSAHRRHASWTPARILCVAQKIGPATTHLTQAIMTARPHPEQGFRTCLGILSLEKTYGKQRLEAACQRGDQINARSVASIQSILKNGLDRAFLEPDLLETEPLLHPNLRDPKYFH